MKKKHLLQCIEGIPDDGDITFSVDVSTGEHDAFNRAYADIIHGWQENGESHGYSILLEGCLNHDQPN